MATGPGEHEGMRPEGPDPARGESPLGEYPIIST